MRLDGLLKLIADTPAARRLLADLQQHKSSRVTVLDAARPALIAALYHQMGRPILLITARPEHASHLQEQLSAWGGGQVTVFPEPDTLPYQQVTSDDAAEIERLRVLSLLAGRIDRDNMPLVVASAPALMHKVSSVEGFSSAWHRLETGMDIPPRQLLEKWQQIGYRRVDTVSRTGEMSQRGGILDVYPPTGEHPLRIEFLGDTIESLRLFDAESQRSLGKIETADIGPAEASTNDGCLLDYLPPEALLVIDEPEAVQNAVDALDEEAVQLYADKLASGELPPDCPRPYFGWEELAKKLNNAFHLALTSQATDEGEGYNLGFTPAPVYAGQMPLLLKKVKQLVKSRHRLVLVSHQAERLSEMLSEEGIIAAPVTEVNETPPAGSLTLVRGLLAGGWTLGDGHLLTDVEIFGFIKQRRAVSRRVGHKPRLYIDITPGDYIVHIEHGIARFSGVTTMPAAKDGGEYLVLEYAGGDRLYVPTDQIDRVSRYIGAGDHQPALNRLGTSQWHHTRQKAQESVEEVARELLGLYAAREVVPGFAFSPDTVWQQELEASFPYVETPDQVTVEDEVKRDMARDRPMDRLILGDVGYGKTEVAIRAAFKAVMDGKQVAVLVPTTVLAQQHYTTFNQRLAAFPVKVEVLSRFRSPREQAEILEELAGGGIDICIGTHRLLQKDVVFKDLGLLIIDEEQRFGVGHKEHLKKMRRSVDVLTLSATPIPRTLHMSLVGARDMSTIETPPGERLPIKTYVAEYDDRLVREAVLRELERNGQVFLVHNRVQSINFVAEKIQTLLPEARLAVAHGRMAEGELEAVMDDFTRGEIDVLVCTTIIESGLDVPNANTLIVNKADKFGLTQLYQLRGRVGRGVNLAYAYFLYDRGKRLTDDAGKRLRTIYEATELGAGFGVAIKDLEIRGAGNLLGVRQSGHINAVGFGLYTQLLAEAVTALREGKSPQEARRLPPPSVDLPVQAYLPEDYIPDMTGRLNIYQRLAGLSSREQVEDMAGELADRFGPLPQETANLLYAVGVKILAARAGIESATTEEGYIVLRLFQGMHFDRHKLEGVLEESVRFGARQIRLDYKKMGDWRKVLEGLLEKAGL